MDPRIPPQLAFAAAKATKRTTIEDVLEIALPPYLDKVFPLKTPTGALRGELTVPFALPHDVLSRFTTYDPQELAHIPSEFDIRGMRLYHPRDLKAGTQGSTEYHRIRVEAICGTRGKITVTVRDLADKERSFSLTRGKGVILPPFIQHTYSIESERLENEADTGLGAELVVIAGTMYNPDDVRTHDTFYTAQKFGEHVVNMWDELRKHTN